jgi:DNA polymerase I-like protein with 3'-5' exonuclease and polymerase domains
MLINADAKALEWLGVVYLSKDKRGYYEIREEIDQHTSNQEDFGLPSRLIAKKFVFRLVYGGSAYAYANDADFTDVSTKEKFWQKVIDKFYLKYSGVREWHESLMEQAMLSGQLVIPTGRVFTFTQEMKGGQLVWPRTTILNYPVQGFGADLMLLARIQVHQRLKDLKDVGVLPVCTVHDSIVYDAPKEWVDQVVEAMYASWDYLPQAFKRAFGVEFDLPTKVEVQVGNDWKHMERVS